MIADRPARGVWADLGHDAGALVPARKREDARRKVAGTEVIVGMAETGGHHLEYQLTLTGLVKVNIEDFPLAWGLRYDGAARFHGCSLHCSSRAL